MRAWRRWLCVSAVALAAGCTARSTETSINVTATEETQNMTAEAQPPEPTVEPTAAPETEVDWKAISQDEWRKRLSDEQYFVTREQGTERPYTGEYWNTKTPGTYECSNCGLLLFTSETKFDSGCGWPSFYDPAKKDAVELRDDDTHGMVRTEVVCKRCGAHLGHVFDDGPQPTGQRYCMNSASLKLKPKQGTDAATKPNQGK